MIHVAQGDQSTDEWYFWPGHTELPSQIAEIRAPLRILLDQGVTILYLSLAVKLFVVAIVRSECGRKKGWLLCHPFS
jgi:hypothetical protein